MEKYCSFDPENPMRHRQFDAIVDALKGCRAVVTAMIGDYPKQELEKAGIAAITAAGPIEDGAACGPRNRSAAAAARGRGRPLKCPCRPVVCL